MAEFGEQSVVCNVAYILIPKVVVKSLKKHCIRQHLRMEFSANHLTLNEALYRFTRRRPQLTRDPVARRQQRIRACYTSLLVGSLQLNTSGRILGWTPNAHSADVCLASCVYAAAHIGRSIGKKVLWDPPPLLERPDSPPRCVASVLDGGTLSTVHSTS